MLWSLNPIGAKYRYPHAQKEEIEKQRAAMLQ